MVRGFCLRKGYWGQVEGRVCTGTGVESKGPGCRIKTGCEGALLDVVRCLVRVVSRPWHRGFEEHPSSCAWTGGRVMPPLSG